MRGKSLVLVGALSLLACAGYPAKAADRPLTLDNGQIQVIFDTDRGTFQAGRAADNSLRLLDAAPTMVINGRTFSAADRQSLRITQQKFKDTLGTGRSLVAAYQFSGPAPALRYELRLYDGKPWLSARVHVDAGDYALGDLSPIRSQLRMPSAFASKVYVSSGVAGSNTGVWPLGMRRWHSDTLSSWYSPQLRENLAFAFYSFSRASTSVTSQYQGPALVSVDAVAHYNEYNPRGQTVDSEELLVNFGRDPLQSLEEWVDAVVKVVHPTFNHDTRTSLDNTWYAIGDKASEEFGVTQAKLLRATPLYDYGVNFFETGEWQLQRNAPGDLGNALGFGETAVDKVLYPHGVPWLCQQYKQLGFGCTFGANYAYAALATSTALARPPWLNTADLAKPDFGYPIDFTHPDAQAWLHDLYKPGADFGAKWIWSDFDGGPKQGALHDPTKIRGFEDIREGIKVIRDSVGPDALLHRFCCGPYYTYLGLVDRVRPGDDVRGIGDWFGLQEVSRQMAASYMLHGKFWINDPDPLLVGAREYVHNYGAGPIPPDPAILDEVHMRMMLQVASGSFLTIGENLEDMTPEKLRLFTQVLPSYGHAARPLDLFQRTTPEVFDLPVATDWERWHVLLLQNWTEEDKKYSIRFSELGLDEQKTYLVFRFWDQAFLGEYRGSAAFDVRWHSGEALSIRELQAHPSVVGTDMHLTQGSVELKDVRFNAGQLSGTALRHPGAQGTITIYLPPGWRLRDPAADVRTETNASGATIARVPLHFAQASLQWTVPVEKSQ